MEKNKSIYHFTIPDPMAQGSWNKTTYVIIFDDEKDVFNHGIFNTNETLSRVNQID